MDALQQGTNLLSSVEFSDHDSFSIGDERPAAEKCEKFVAFFLGMSIYCIPSKAVLEVVHPLSVAALPNAPSSISGIAAFKGEVVAVINIKKVLSLEESTANGKAKFVILQAKAKDTQYAIPVDSMHELISVDPAAISPDPNNSRGGLTRLVEHESSVLTMIEPDILFVKLEESVG